MQCETEILSGIPTCISWCPALVGPAMIAVGTERTPDFEPSVQVDALKYSEILLSLCVILNLYSISIFL